MLSQRTVEVHVGHVFGKLGIPDAQEVNRRVVAILTHLRAVHDWG